MLDFQFNLRIPIGTNDLSLLKSNTNSGFTRTLIPIIAEQLA